MMDLEENQDSNLGRMNDICLGPCQRDLRGDGWVIKAGAKAGPWPTIIWGVCGHEQFPASQIQTLETTYLRGRELMNYWD